MQVSLKEYAEREGISKTAARKRIESGQVKGSQVGGLWFVEVPTANLKPPTNGSTPPTKTEKPPTANHDRQPYPIADGRFEDIGRMRPVDGMVKVFWGPGEDDRMVPESDWKERMGLWCEHNLPGWSCTKCLQSNGVMGEKRIDSSPNEQGYLYLTDEYHTLEDGRRIQLRRRSKEPKENWVRV